MDILEFRTVGVAAILWSVESMDNVLCALWIVEYVLWIVDSGCGIGSYGVVVVLGSWSL